MRKNQPQGTVFYCFSPAVMLTTFVIEIGYICYVLFRYKLSRLTAISLAMLFCLAIFQLAEYFICGSYGTSWEIWSRIGFIAITFLPPLGIHFIYEISGRKWSKVVGIVYGMALAWIAAFVFAGKVFNQHICGGNYIIFHMSGRIGGLYYFYYYFWLFVSLGLCVYFARKSTKRTANVLYLLLLGYSLFIIPTVSINLLKSGTAAGLPSIMCGFAVIFATVITFLVIPKALKLRKQISKNKK